MCQIRKLLQKLICPNEGKKMTPDHVCKNMFSIRPFLQPEGCRFFLSSMFSALVLAALIRRFCRARRREKRHRSHLPIQPWGKPENTKHIQIFSPRRNIPSLAAAALVRGQAEDDYFLSISHEHRKLSCVFHSTLGPLLLTSHCHCTVCRCRPRRRCVHRSC